MKQQHFLWLIGAINQNKSGAKMKHKKRELFLLLAEKALCFKLKESDTKAVTCHVDGLGFRDAYADFFDCCLYNSQSGCLSIKR